MFTKAIVRPPEANFANGLTTAGLGAPDYALALQQHDAYCAALERSGLTLIRLDADLNYPDSCFVEDTAVMVKALTEINVAAVHAGTYACLSLPGATSRAGEVDSIRAVFKNLLPQHALHQIKAPGTLDGGDVCEAGNHYFIGVSARTNEAGAEQLASFVAAHGYTSSFVDIRDIDSLLHLKSGLAYVGDNRLVVTEALAARDEFAWFERVVVPPDEDYAANCLRVNDYVLVAAGFEQFAQKLRQLGYRILVIEMSEFEKMDGGLSCLSLRW
jgi:dimethylargininase